MSIGKKKILKITRNLKACIRGEEKQELVILRKVVITVITYRANFQKHLMCLTGQSPSAAVCISDLKARFP